LIERCRGIAGFSKQRQYPESVPLVARAQTVFDRAALLARIIAWRERLYRGPHPIISALGDIAAPKQTLASMTKTMVRCACPRFLWGSTVKANGRWAAQRLAVRPEGANHQ
jgi:hypothetical protein